MNDPTPRTLYNRAIGIRAAGTRDDTDSMGAIGVPAERYWGADAARPRPLLDRRHAGAISQGDSSLEMPFDRVDSYLSPSTKGCPRRPKES